MTRSIRSRYVLATAVIVGFVGAWGPVRVDAHASFVEAPATVGAGSEIALTMNVPHERDDTTFNVGVAIRLPQGWSALACQAKSTWTCSIGNESGLAVVRFDKKPGAAPAEDETFDITVRTGPAAGAASFPTLQTYNTGETVGWIGEAASVTPAPTLQVVGTAATTTNPAAPAATIPPAAPTVAPAPTAAAATTPAPPPTITTPPQSSTSSSTTAVPTTTTSEPATTAESTDTALSLLPIVTEPTETDSEGGNGGVVAAIVVLLLAAAGSGLYIYLRRRPQTIPPV